MCGMYVGRIFRAKALSQAPSLSQLFKEQVSRKIGFQKPIFDQAF